MSVRHPLTGVLAILAILAGGCATSAERPERRERPRLPTEARELSPDDPGHPLYPQSLLRRGSMLLDQGRTDDALALFEEARSLQPANATAHLMVGEVHLAAGRHADAIAAYDAALRVAPAFTAARNSRGVAYLASGQLSRAENDFLGVLSDGTFPHRWPVFYNLGSVYLERGELDAAAENFRRAARAPDPVYQAFPRLVEIAMQRGDTAAAVELLEEARMMFPGRVDPALRLGRLLLLLGERERGARYLREVLDAAPDSEAAREASELLADG